jgi:processive 1,2-diacylglycerol beta-glucosyltransferase
MSKGNTTKTYLILSASYGSGHVRAAEALAEHLTNAGHTTVHKDLLSFFSERQSRLLRAPYLYLMRHAPRIYGIGYALLQYRIPLAIFKLSYQPIIRFIDKNILSYISSIQPDYICCTHFTWGEILDRYITNNIDMAPYYMVVTDYTYHSIWKNIYSEGYFLGAEDVRKKFLLANIPKNKLFVTGIPVSPIFSDFQTTQRTGITILLGGYGLTFPKTYIDTIISDTHRHTPIHIICGNNPALQAKIHAMYQHTSHVTVHGWVTNVQEYICTSEYVLTKTGGITITECLTAGTPIKALPPIPGQETDNYYFLNSHNLLAPNTKQKNTDVIPVFSLQRTPWMK